MPEAISNPYQLMPMVLEPGSPAGSCAGVAAGSTAHRNRGLLVDMDRFERTHPWLTPAVVESRVALSRRVPGRHPENCGAVSVSEPAKIWRHAYTLKSFPLSNVARILSASPLDFGGTGRSGGHFLFPTGPGIHRQFESLLFGPVVCTGPGSYNDHSAQPP